MGFGADAAISGLSTTTNGPLPDDLSDGAVEIARSLAASMRLCAFALVALLIIAVVAVLGVAKALVMPVTAAFIVGSMLSDAISSLEKFRIPRVLSMILVLATSAGLVALVLALVSAPLLEWVSRLPDLAYQLKDRIHVFDRPLAFWNEVQQALGARPADASQLLPRVEWVQPTLEFLSPTMTELLLFVVSLLMFTLSWPNLRRALVLTFEKRDSRLRVLRILNQIQELLGKYLLTVTVINMGVGVMTGLISLLAGLPNPAGLGALAAMMNYIPIIGPAATFMLLLILGASAAPSFGVGLSAPLLFAALTFLEGHFVTPSIIGRHLSLNALAVFLAFAFWTWLWGPMGAFLASPMLIVALILKEHVFPSRSPQLPDA